jgi:hypothetical protein
MAGPASVGGGAGTKEVWMEFVVVVDRGEFGCKFSLSLFFFSAVSFPLSMMRLGGVRVGGGWAKEREGVVGT